MHFMLFLSQIWLYVKAVLVIRRRRKIRTFTKTHQQIVNEFFFFFFSVFCWCASLQSGRSRAEVLSSHSQINLNFQEINSAFSDRESPEKEKFTNGQKYTNDKQKQSYQSKKRSLQIVKNTQYYRTKNRYHSIIVKQFII